MLPMATGSTATENSGRARIKVDHPDCCLISGVGGGHGTFINAYDVFSSHWNAERSLVSLKLPQCRTCLDSTDIRGQL
jgi:hypothetical protein